MGEGLCGGRERVSLLARWLSHPIHPFPFSAPLHFIHFLLFSSHSPSQPSPSLSFFPIPIHREHFTCIPQHDSTMARSQSLLTPEPTHIVRQPVTICHVCVSSLRTFSPMARWARSLMPCHAKPRPWPPFWTFCILVGSRFYS